MRSFTNLVKANTATLAKYFILPVSYTHLSPIPALTSNLAVWRSVSCRKRQGSRFASVVTHPVEYLPYCLGLRASQYFRHQFHWFPLSRQNKKPDRPDAWCAGCVRLYFYSFHFLWWGLFCRGFRITGPRAFVKLWQRMSGDVICECFLLLERLNLTV